MKKYLLPIILLTVLIILAGCGQVEQEKIFRNGVVVASEKYAAETGLEILKNDGNAFDAAVATALALQVTYPKAGNIGGGGFAVVYHAESQEVYFLDFREKAPQNINPDFCLTDSGTVDRDKLLYGPTAAGVPGTVAGLSELHRSFGSLPWANIVQPARMLADTGIIMTDQLHQSLAEYEDVLRQFTATAVCYFPNGTLTEAGHKFYQKDLARTLAAIENDGADGFYKGPIAEKIAAYCNTAGGFVTLEDLANYLPQWRQPVNFKFRDLTVYSAGLSSSGGIVMGQILKMLDFYELERYTSGAAEYIHLFTEAARRAYADRSEYLGDPDFTPNRTSQLLDQPYIDSRVQSIDMRHATSSSEILPGMPKGKEESESTTHLVVCDKFGNIVSLTYTINLSYGCRAVVPGTGFLLNNEMDDFAAAPGATNAFGLSGGEANRIEGGKRMLSSMTPTIVFRGDQPYLALGSPGGSKIITAVTQTIINKRVYNMNLTEAISAPRFHHQWRPDILYVEENGFDPDIIKSLTAMGHTVEARPPYCEVMAVEFSPDGLFMTGVPDPREDGFVAGY